MLYFTESIQTFSIKKIQLFLIIAVLNRNWNTKPKYFCTSTYLAIYLFIYLSIYLSIYLYQYLYEGPAIKLQGPYCIESSLLISVIYLSVCLYICLSIFPSIYLTRLTLQMYSTFSFFFFTDFFTWGSSS